MSKQILKPTEALTMLEAIQKENVPARRQAALNTIVESAIGWALQAQNRDGHLLQRIEVIEKMLKIPVRAKANGAKRAAAPTDVAGAPESAAVPPGVVVAEDGEIHGLDGLSEEDRKAAVEAAMDSAIGDAPPNPAGEAAPPAAP